MHMHTHRPSITALFNSMSLTSEEEEVQAAKNSDYERDIINFERQNLVSTFELE
jgi:tetrahydromethanopterin S-methyltransferase subunit H